MSKLQDFDDLTRNNDRPSDKALAAVKNLLVGPTKQLEDIDAEMHRLEEAMRELQEKRVKIDNSVRHYKCISAPIRRIPPDILFKIFRHCQPTHRNPTMAASEAPMLLTRVCSRWRSIALASPRLWARIHVSFRKESSISGGIPGYPAISSETVSSFLQLRCHALKEWLSRSGNCPLSISINYPPTYTTSMEPLDKSTILLLKTILLFSSRWRTLELNVPTDVYIELESMLSDSTLLILAQLRVLVRGCYPGTFIEVEYPPAVLLKSPSLKRISISLPYSNIGLAKYIDVKILPWRNITHFYNHALCTMLDTITLLKCCSRLVHASLTLTSEGDLEVQETIPLPFLMSLWITEASQSSSVMDSIYQCINAPDLRWIQHQIDAYSGRDMISNDYRGPSVLPLVERAVGIRILEIDRFHFSPDTLRRILEVPSATFYLNTLHLNAPRSHMGLDCADPFDLNDLIVKDVPDLNDRSALLPRLENFELYTTRVSHDTLLEFVTSRMDKKSPIYVLKKVVIVFDLLQEKDQSNIEQEIRKRAAAAGIEIDVTIRYPSPNTGTYLDPLSPSHIRDGLYLQAQDADVTSWNFPELTLDMAEDGSM
ncbi:hypothetical protein CVT25_007389 [Psilocybe cyanescens]|uniref:F-box domain-containing protein n=1 Tax=Psilocybe cyanescens TaxID=93625 RepID=A0A409XJC9_PSICY|nr:hypothetical protein CVT25_007389 [Psilocybe cyanescens]